MQQIIVKPVETEAELRTCIDCNSTAIITDDVTGDRICTSCGTIQLTKDECAYSHGLDEMRSHETPSTSLPIKGSYIRWASRTKLPCLRRGKYGLSHQATRLNRFLADIKSIAPHYGVSIGIINDAYDYVRTLVSKKVSIRGRWPVVFAAMAVATRMRGQPRFVDELIPYAVDRRDWNKYNEMKHSVFKYIRVITKVCGLKKVLVPPEEYIKRFAKHESLKLDQVPILELASKLREQQPLLMESGSPYIIASCLIYISAILQGRDIHQTELCKITRCSLISLRSRYLKMVDALGLPIQRGKLIEC